MGRCKRIKPLNEGIVTTWGGNVLLAICPECFPDTPLLMRKHPRGIEAKVANDHRDPPDLVVTSDMSEVDRYVGQEALSKSKKTEL